MEYAAIRHFADKNYCFALEKGRFLIRLEVKKGDAARVVLHTQDKYLPLRLADNPPAPPCLCHGAGAFGRLPRLL